jgi:N,N'-diacetyllegionaminate synthase
MKLIAEFCQNHNGNFNILKQMIHDAAEGGATHGKIQTIYADDLSFRKEFETGSVDRNGQITCIKRAYQTEYDRLRALELTREQHRLFIEECQKFSIIPLTTVFNITRIAELKDLGWKTVKVASYDCASLPLIQELANYFEELIISTGATYDHEIETTAQYLNNRKHRFTFLHCVTIYPTPLYEMNLKRMNYLRNFTSSIGLSEHSLVGKDGVNASLAAIYFGADTIERHFTVLPEDETRDGRVSIRKVHLQQLRDFEKLSKEDQKSYLEEKVPMYEKTLGSAKRELSHEELLNRAYYRGRFCNKIKEKQIYNWEDSENHRSLISGVV